MTIYYHWTYLHKPTNTLGQGINFRQTKLQKISKSIPNALYNDDLRCDYGIRHEEKNIIYLQYA